MPGSSNSSFIPKRDPQQQSRRDPRRQIYVGTFVIRILFFAVIVSAALVFFYERQLKIANNAEIVALDTAIASFNEAEMQRVINVHNKLRQVRERLLYSASVVSIFDAIESSITESNRVTKMSIERADEGSFEVDLTVQAKDFNAVLFQEKILKDSQVLSVQQIDELAIQSPAGETDSEELVSVDVPPGTITFNLLIGVDPASIPHTPASASISTPISAPDVEPLLPATTTASGTNDILL